MNCPSVTDTFIYNTHQNDNKNVQDIKKKLCQLTTNNKINEYSRNSEMMAGG